MMTIKKINNVRRWIEVMGIFFLTVKFERRLSQIYIFFISSVGKFVSRSCSFSFEIHCRCLSSGRVKYLHSFGFVFFQLWAKKKNTGKKKVPFYCKVWENNVERGHEYDLRIDAKGNGKK